MEATEELKNSRSKRALFEEEGSKAKQAPGAKSSQVLCLGQEGRKSNTAWSSVVLATALSPEVKAKYGRCGLEVVGSQAAKGKQKVIEIFVAGNWGGLRKAITKRWTYQDGSTPRPYWVGPVTAAPKSNHWGLYGSLNPTQAWPPSGEL